MRSKNKRVRSEDYSEVVEVRHVYESVNSQKPLSLKDVNVKISCKSDNQIKLYREIMEKEIVFCQGLAGTGKTFIAAGAALNLLKYNPDKYKKIVLIKSVTTLKDENIGFLPGEMLEKMEPFLYSFSGNFEKIIGKKLYDYMVEKETIDVKPITYLRGVNIDNAIVIIDECQNITIKNLRTILSRLGTDSKMIFLGDSNQIDITKKGLSSLGLMFLYFKDFEEFGFIELGKEDQVRNKLITKIEDRFESQLSWCK